MNPHSILVKAVWDDEAGVFVATSSDVPGLVTEAATPEKLLAKLKEMIPDLLEMNTDTGDGGVEVPLYVMHEQMSKVRLGT